MREDNENSIDPQLASLIGHAATPEAIGEAVRKPVGARFYKCALQVNPFAYTTRHSKQSGSKTEDEYNHALLDSLLREGVEVVGITDHFRIANSESLATALRAAGIHVFLGFEACSNEGVHLLCLFPGSTSSNELERIIGKCGVTDLEAESPQSDKSCDQLLQQIPALGGAVIAAHACSKSGLLEVLKGQARARVWTNPNLLAIAIAGPRASVPEAYKDIVANKDSNHRRSRPIAAINANDISAPSMVKESSSTTFIKMAVPTVEGLRQAFLDWESRIRLNTDPRPTQHTELIAAAWSGGLLDGQSLRFNESLNVLVGGRGAGKSTLIESLRYAFALTPKGDEAKRAHESMIKNVLGQGSSIAVLVRSPVPSPQYYLIERIYGSRPRVRNQNGELLQGVSPESILGTLEVYGQHEISELTRFPEKLAEMLRRFAEPTSDQTDAKAELREQLEHSRSELLAELTEIARIEEALAALPALKEHLKRFEVAGLDEKLKSKTLIDREARIFEEAQELVNAARELAAYVNEQSASDGPLVGEDKGQLPNATVVAKLNDVQSHLLQKIKGASAAIGTEAAKTQRMLDKIKIEWSPMRKAADDAYQKTLRELKAEGHDAAKFVTYKDQVERLGPKATELKARKKTLEKLQKERVELLARWEAAKAQDFRELQKAARKVSRRLKDRVRVTVRQSDSLDQVETALRSHCTGNISQALERLRTKESLNLSELGSAIAEGAHKLVQAYAFSQVAAEKIAQGGTSLALEVEECEMGAEAVLELNVGTEDAQTWKELDQLSTGQKATAVLLLLLLESDAPLLVDQPEDDLDNRFIAERVVPTMRDEKRKRQFVFSTHNANIPVLGDAEQIVGLIAVVEGGIEHSTIPNQLCGSIDTLEVKELVKELLEGGQEAFELRRQKYGF